MDKNIELEKDYVTKVINTLSQHLKVSQEVKCDCGKCRIDIIVTTKEGYRFGIECKRTNSKKGEEMGKFIQQAVRYSNHTFSKEYIPIFIAPALSYNYFVLNEEVKDIEGVDWVKDRHGKNHQHHSFNGFLGDFGIGELRKYKDELFYFSFSNKIIWTSKKWYSVYNNAGTHQENYDKLIKKIQK